MGADGFRGPTTLMGGPHEQEPKRAAWLVRDWPWGCVSRSLHPQVTPLTARRRLRVHGKRDSLLGPTGLPAAEPYLPLQGVHRSANRVTFSRKYTWPTSPLPPQNTLAISHRPPDKIHTSSHGPQDIPAPPQSSSRGTTLQATVSLGFPESLISRGQGLAAAL